MSKRMLQAIGPVGILALWEIAFRSGLLNRTLLPSPSQALESFVRLIVTGSIFPDLGFTLGRMMTGYLLASVVGVTIGLAMGWFRGLYLLLEGPLDFFRSLPVTTLYPLFVLFFGVGHASKIAMVFVASLFVIVLSSAYGVVQGSRIRREMVRLFGGSRSQRFVLVIFFDALPQTLIGLRIALSYALIVEVVCEMFMGAQRGMGQRVFEAYNTYRIADLYALILMMGIIGYGANILFIRAERRLAHWSNPQL